MSSIPEGSIIITPTEVYNEVKSLTEAVRNLIANDESDAKARTDLATRLERIDQRVTAVERRMLLFTGFAAALGASAGTWFPRLISGG